uniref:Uncharacterized protein n=1 Tax=Romanomermis culicivorax TaxID=13658 RepID=A0A915KWG4_ROMCU
MDQNGKQKRYECEHPCDSKDQHKKVKWASALKCNQIRQELIEKEKGQQPTAADSEKILKERYGRLWIFSQYPGTS